MLLRMSLDLYLKGIQITSVIVVVSIAVNIVVRIELVSNAALGKRKTIIRRIRLEIS